MNVFCHSWPKPWSGPGHALAGDGIVLRPDDAGRREPIDRLRPVGASRLPGRGVGLAIGCLTSGLLQPPGQVVAAATAAASLSWISIASSRRVSSKIWR